jgi:hypothetical protein
MTTRRYTPEEVRDLHGFKAVETVYLRCRRGAWPHHRDGRKLYFTDDDLAAIEEAQRVPARAVPTTGRTEASAAYHATKPATSGRKSRIR